MGAMTMDIPGIKDTMIGKKFFPNRDSVPSMETKALSVDGIHNILAHILSNIKNSKTDHHDRNHAGSSLVREIVIVGGSALCLSGVRDTTGDLDLLVPFPLQSIVSSVQKAFPDLVIDMTEDDHCWGGLRSGKGSWKETTIIQPNPCGGDSVFRVKIMSLEEIWIRKAIDSCREDKDIPDLYRIAEHTTPEKIVAEFSRMVRTNDRFEMNELADLLLSEISATFNREISSDLIRGLGLPKKETKEKLIYWNVPDKEKVLVSERSMDE